jgi:hypothetical protein
MVYFQSKNPNLGKFWRALDWKMLIYFICRLEYFRTLEIFYDHLVHFVLFGYIFFRFLYHAPRKIWQPWFFVTIFAAENQFPQNFYEVIFKRNSAQNIFSNSIGTTTMFIAECQVAERHNVKFHSVDLSKCQPSKMSTFQNVDLPKCWPSKMSIFKKVNRPKCRVQFCWPSNMLTFQNVDLPKCWPSKMSIFKKVNRPKCRVQFCWPSNMLTFQNVDLPKCQPSKMSTVQNVDLLKCGSVKIVYLPKCRPAKLSML